MGGNWISCQVPVGKEVREVLLGCQINDYPVQQVYLGNSIGRYANRIANSQFEFNGKRYLLNRTINISINFMVEKGFTMSVGI